MSNSIAICIPTYNAGKIWQEVLKQINSQNITPVSKIILDSQSSDETVSLAHSNGFSVLNIHPENFDHGGSRQTLVDSCIDADIVVFLTQDAILTDEDSIKNIIEAFDDPEVALAYGRQLPHVNAKILETHARLFNYPAISQIRSILDIPTFGFKTIFCSNSFAAYRVSALKGVGGFPRENIMGEDTIIAASLLGNNWKIAYVAEAKVFHSHSYTFSQEFKRYFDTGVFHAQNKSLYKSFGKPTGVGLKYVKSEFKYSISKNVLIAVSVIPRAAIKFVGFKLGFNYSFLPLWLIKKLSMHKNYWNKTNRFTRG